MVKGPIKMQKKLAMGEKVSVKGAKTAKAPAVKPAAKKTAVKAVVAMKKGGSVGKKCK
jgi:hypothetical protein